jgi:tetratricopeptide (TPR) repeat protein
MSRFSLSKSPALAAALLVAPVLFAGAVSAQETTTQYPECTRQATESDVAAAKGAFQAGQVSYNEGDYDRAITYWEDAFRRDCSALPLLKNLARAYEAAGKKKQAVVCLETFNARNPNSGEKDQIERRVEVLKRQIEAEEKARGGTAPTASSTATTAPTDGPPPPPPETAHRPIWPLFVAGGGLVLSAVGLGLYFPAVSEKDRIIREECGGNKDLCTPEGKKLGEDNNSKLELGSGLAIAGGVVLAAGLVYYFVQPVESPKPSARRRTYVAPAVGPGFTGLSLSGSF